MAAAAGTQDLTPGDFMLSEALRDTSAVEGLDEQEAQAVQLERLFAGHILGPDGKPLS